LAEATFAIVAPSIGMAETEPTEATLATNAVATTNKNVNLRIARSFGFLRWFNAGPLA
jgi:hypothetical protein